MFADGENFALMPPVRDHKRIGEGDTGPNTGGMGTITDDSLLTEAQTQQIVEEIIKPTLKGCRDEGFPFRGILFLGLMMAEGRSLTVREGLGAGQEKGLPNGQASEPKAAVPMLLEYNVRFGDPETQAILVRLETDFVDICEAMLASGSEPGAVSTGSSSLADLNIEWKPGSSACVVLASKGYPQKPQTGDSIHGLEKAAATENVTIFHAGTARQSEPGAIATGEIFVTAAGRVLGVTATSENLDTALNRAYEAVGEISWPGMQYRKDIGI
jgi:phosphoribosylamine--glycine ligase